MNRARLPRWVGYSVAVLLVAVVTALLASIRPHVPLGSHPIAYVLVIMAVAYWFGEGPAIVALLLGLTAFDYFFIPPLYTLWPHAVTGSRWASYIAFLLGTVMVLFLMSRIRKSQLRSRSLVEALSSSEERLRLAQTAAKVATWDWDPETAKLETTSEWYDLFGLDPAALTYESWSAKVYPDDIERLEALRDESIACHKPFDAEYRIIRAPGDIRWINVKGGAVYDDAGRVLRVIGVDIDITQRKQAEDTVRRQLSLLQEALVPPQPFVAEGYEAAAAYIPARAGEQIGGDFYDVFRTEDGRIGMVVGDVSGKGVEAAALAAAARSTVRAFAYELPSPGAALTHTNAVLQAQEEDTARFVTMFLITMDPSTGKIEYAAAGHPPPATRRADGSVEFLHIGNVAAGIFPGVRYTTFESALRPGDMIVLYTDGILEARREAELFNQEGVQRVLVDPMCADPRSTLSCLLDAAREWSRDRLQDDITVLAVRREAEV